MLYLDQQYLHLKLMHLILYQCFLYHQLNLENQIHYHVYHLELQMLNHMANFEKCYLCCQHEIFYFLQRKNIDKRYAGYPRTQKVKIIKNINNIFLYRIIYHLPYISLVIDFLGY